MSRYLSTVSTGGLKCECSYRSSVPGLDDGVEVLEYLSGLGGATSPECRRWLVAGSTDAWPETWMISPLRAPGNRPRLARVHGRYELVSSQSCVDLFLIEAGSLREQMSGLSAVPVVLEETRAAVSEGRLAAHVHGP